MDKIEQTLSELDIYTGFDGEYMECPARIFDNSVDATLFTNKLCELEISFMTRILLPKKRHEQTVKTVVVLLDANATAMH